MLLGAASALISAYLKFRNLPDPQIQSSAVTGQEDIVSPVLVPEPAPAKPVPTAKHVKVRLRNIDRADQADHVVNTPALSESDELHRIRQAVLLDQWEERRARRVTRREQRRGDRSLSNINEIFEGRRRP